jgi:NCAIR mutase (PurE)-related protein
MKQDRLRRLLKSVQSGEMTIPAALDALKHLPFEDVDFALIDHHRELRRGFPEVVFCQGKTTEQVVSILERIAQHGGTFLATRVDPSMAEKIMRQIPEADYSSTARIVHRRSKRPPRGGPTILVISAGTSDIPVAEEAAVTAEVMGCQVERLYDVGVAGLHRLLGHWDRIRRARAIVVVAGMEGALASVVGGLVDVPVVAVPTSVGYGASFGGLAALLAMLNSCASGVTVVNIDNGFGAGYATSLMVSAASKRTRGRRAK